MRLLSEIGCRFVALLLGCHASANGLLLAAATLIKSNREYDCLNRQAAGVDPVCKGVYATVSTAESLRYSIRPPAYAVQNPRLMAGHRLGFHGPAAKLFSHGLGWTFRLTGLLRPRN